VVKRVNRGDQSPLLRYEGGKGVYHEFDELSERITGGQIKDKKRYRSEGRVQTMKRVKSHRLVS